MEAELTQKVKAGLNSRGATTIRGYARVFKNLDWQGDRRLDLDDMVQGLEEYGCPISKAEAQQMIGMFDKDGDGKLNFDEFLAGIRGPLNETR